MNGALKLTDALHDAVQAVSRHASRAAAAIIMADSPKQYPHDWRDGGAAFGRNFGDCLATELAANAGRYVAGTLAHEDPRYYPDRSKNAFHRTYHALAFTLIDRSDASRPMLAISNLAGSAAGYDFRICPGTEAAGEQTASSFCSQELMNPGQFISMLLLVSLPASIPPGVRSSLSGERVEFPKDLASPISFLIVGFSQKSADQATEWGKAIDGLGTCHGQPLSWFQLPVLAGAPGFLRPLIMRSMRSGLTRSLQSHFVPITDHEAGWKRVAGYQDTDAGRDDAYVMAADEKGQILAKWHGLRQSSEPLLQETFRRYCRPK